MALLGLGIGMMMQNLVLAVQNQWPRRTSARPVPTVTFFRSLGGAVGVSALGAVLSSHVADLTTKGLAAVLRYGLAAPAGTPPAVIARLNKELNAALFQRGCKEPPGNGRRRSLAGDARSLCGRHQR